MKDIEIKVRREPSHIERLCESIMYPLTSDSTFKALASLGMETRRALCDMISASAILDAGDIRRDANFAVNKLSETLERTTKMLQEKEQTIEDMACLEPRRNCERFNSGDPSKDIRNSWAAFRETHSGIDASTEEYERWLFEPIMPIAFKKTGRGDRGMSDTNNAIVVVSKTETTTEESSAVGNAAKLQDLKGKCVVDRLG